MTKNVCFIIVGEFIRIFDKLIIKDLDISLIDSINPFLPFDRVEELFQLTGRRPHSKSKIQ